MLRHRFPSFAFFVFGCSFKSSRTAGRGGSRSSALENRPIVQDMLHSPNPIDPLLSAVASEKRSKHWIPLMSFAVILLLAIIGFIVWGLWS
jgi:hypothetical protein